LTIPRNIDVGELYRFSGEIALLSAGLKTDEARLWATPPRSSIYRRQRAAARNVFGTTPAFWMVL